MIKCGSVIAKSMIRIPLIMPAITKAFGLLLLNVTLWRYEAIMAKEFVITNMLSTRRGFIKDAHRFAKNPTFFLQVN